MTSKLDDNLISKSTSVIRYLQPIQYLLDDPDVYEVSINKPFEVWTTSFNTKQVHHIKELTYDYLVALAKAILIFNNKRKFSPRNSIILPNGERGEIVLPPGCHEGFIGFAFRKLMKTVKSLNQLNSEGVFNSFRDVSFNTPSASEANERAQLNDITRLEKFELDLLSLKREKCVVEFLKQCILNKRNIWVIGKTGSGKTTFIRALIDEIPKNEKLITIEDVFELLVTHPEHFAMRYGDGENELSARECLRSSMRLSPDRIFLAELRGNEAWDYISTVSNSGHPGSITTVHADSAVMSFYRVASLIKQSEIGKTLEMDFIMHKLYTSVDVILFMHNRKLTELFYDPIFKKQHFK